MCGAEGQEREQGVHSTA